MKMMFHIDDFKCMLCAHWFCPPFNLPYLLPCSHSICTSCLQKASQSGDHIVCPEDLETCPLQAICLNTTTKRALERLMKQHKNYNENSQLECIKALSIGFDELIGGREKEVRSLEALIDQIFSSEIDRLRHVQQRIKMEINRPYRLVEDWKDIVATHLTAIRKNYNSNNRSEHKSSPMVQLNHYIEEGRRMKMELNQFFGLDFGLFADGVMRNPKICFQKDFAITQQVLETKLSGKNSHYKLQQQSKEQGSSKKSKNQQISELQKTGLIRQLKPLGQVDTNSAVSEFERYNNTEQTRRGSRGGANTADNRKERDSSNNFSKYFRHDLSHNSSANSHSKVYGKRQVNNRANHQQNKQNEEEAELGRTTLNIRVSNNRFDEEDDLALKQEPRFDFLKPNTKLASIAGTPHQSLKNAEKQPQQLDQLQKMDKLAHMLDNKSRQASLRSSLQAMQLKNSQAIHSSSMDNSLLMSPGTIGEQYTEEAEPVEDEEQLLNSDEDAGNKRSRGRINFLKEWDLPKSRGQSPELPVRQNNYHYDCERAIESRFRKTQIDNANYALQETEVAKNSLCLVNYPLHDVDMDLYLSNFDWKHSSLKIVKFVKTGLRDEQLNILLNYLVNSNVQTLVLCLNSLTELSLDACLNFVGFNSSVKTINLSKNGINSLRTKPKINKLIQKGIAVFL